MQPQRIVRLWGFLMTGNIALPFFTGPLDFFPNHTALRIALAYAIACAGFHLCVTHYLRRSSQTQLSIGAGQASDIVNEPLGSRVLLALVIFVFTFLAMARGVSGLGTWLVGFDSDVTYTVTRVHWVNGKYRDCYRYEFKEQDAYTEIFNKV